MNTNPDELWDKLFGKHVAPEEYRRAYAAGELLDALSGDLAACWLNHPTDGMTQEEIDRAAALLADWLNGGEP